MQFIKDKINTKLTLNMFIYLVVYNVLTLFTVDFITKDFQMIYLLIITLIILIAYFVINRHSIFNTFDKDMTTVLDKSHVLGLVVFFLFITNYTVSAISYYHTGVTALIHSTSFIVDYKLVIYCITTIILVPFINGIVFYLSLFKETNFLKEHTFYKRVICGIVFGIIQCIFSGFLDTGFMLYLVYAFGYYVFYYLVTSYLYKKYDYSLMVPIMMNVLLNIVTTVVLLT